MTREYGEYLVTGTRRYRGHEPGTTFEAILEPGPEGRAFQRGDIKLLRRFTPTLEPGSYLLPDDWPPRPAAPTTEARERGSLHCKGG